MKSRLPVPACFTRPFLLFLCWVALVFTSAQASAQVSTKEDHPCAVTRINNTSLLLADGITSEDHRSKMRQYDLHWYKLDLALERNSIDIRGNVILAGSSLQNSLTEFAFELHPNFTIQEVLLDGASCSVTRNGSEVLAALPKALARQEKFSVQVFYAGRAPSGAGAAIGNGFNTATAQPWGQQVTWSLSEPFAASEWFPCKQLLEDKADSVDVWVTTDVSNKVGSNGLLQRITPLLNQKHRYEWKSKYPIAYYLISVAVSNYQEYSFQVPLPGTTQPMLVQNYVYPQALATFKSEIDRTGPFLQLFSEKFGLYPFQQEKYGHSMAPIGGGMEHQTMTTQSTFEFTLTAHELAHQWWGDEVTCKDWSHIWLNEGFASYGELLALENLLPAEKLNWLNRASQSALIQPQGSVFVKDSTVVPRIFSSALSYRKGAMVLHMLRYALQNDAVFFQALQAYREEFRYKVANTRDFQKVVEHVSGRSFQYFFDQWIYGEGFPIFSVFWAQKGNQVFLRSIESSSSAATPFFKTQLEVKISTSVKDTVVVINQEEYTQDLQFKVTGQVLSLEVDPAQWHLEQVKEVVFDPFIAELLSAPVVVYPNPTSGEVRLKGGEGLPEQIIIQDMVGRHIRTFVPTSRTFSLADLGAGAYFLRLKYGESYILQRVVKL
ncbi:M1 family aminopeptidase [Rufibacter sediminis]|uniref:Aminopeptidase N n=1 Tax=Rufibacter sediminis TaxID=2762756 RepID=A0ABR6VLA6_9BACT|nr:M1 family aminopeptidase [Rufibacter sediminis]MBC3538053.1 T9SS type A sorting domain-containing protein [Rufibacter sediminis]